MTQAFYRKWRPQTWDEVIGQDQVIQTLRNAVRGSRTGHAYLFAGPRGTGKTSTARLLAKALNCVQEDPTQRPCGSCEHCRAIQDGRFLDLIEIDAASNTSVEDVRDLRDKINFSPNQGRYKVYIIDEVHMLSTAAFNALLKTLEEPPPHAVFILATTEVHKIPATVLSRCQRHEFRRLPADAIVPYLQQKAGEEGLEVDPEVLPLIARQATGSLRDAISLLDQLSSTGGKVTLLLAREVLGTATNEAVVELLQAMVDNDPASGLEIIQQALDRGTDPRQFSRQMVDYLHGLLLVKMGAADLARSSLEQPESAGKLVEPLALDFLLAVINRFQEATQERQSTRIPSLPLEISFLEGLQLLHSSDSETAPSGTAVQQQPVMAPARGRAAQPQHTAAEAESTARKIEPGGREVVQELADAEPVERTVQPVNGIGGSPADSSTEVLQTSVGDDFQTVRREWKRFLQEVRQRDPILQGLINSSKPLGFEEGTLILGFETELLREKMMKPDKLQIALEALEVVLGRQSGIRGVLSGQWNPRQQTGPGSTIPEAGIVATAVQQFGAQVVDIEDVDDMEFDPEGQL